MPETTKKHDISNEPLDQLLANYQSPDDQIGEDGLLKQFTKRLVESEHPAQARAGEEHPLASATPQPLQDRIAGIHTTRDFRIPRA